MQEEDARKKTPSLMGRCSGQGSACLGDRAEDRLSSRWVFGWGVVVCRKLGGKLGEIGSSESLDSKIEEAAELPSVLSTQKRARCRAAGRCQTASFLLEGHARHLQEDGQGQEPPG